VESYCRAVVTSGAIECIAGVEMRYPGEFFEVLAEAQRLMREAIDGLDGSHAVTNPAFLAHAIRELIESAWPDRYWFIECCTGQDRDGWCQVFSPPARRWALVQEVA
jgi:hypothetical protein